LTLVVVTPVNAANRTYTAGGTVTTYVDAWSSYIVSGHWSVVVSGNTVTEFKMLYVERNLDWTIEDSPDGSSDQFWHELIWASAPTINDGVLSFDCTMKITKLKSMMDGTKSWVIWDTAVFHITIGPDGMLLDRPPFPSTPEQDFDVVGTTTHIKN